MANLYEAIGGADACHRLAGAFYAKVGRDPLLRPLFPGKSFTCAIEEFAAFLAQFLGGPAQEMQRRRYLSLHHSHARFRITAEQRDAWMRHMAAALSETGIPEPTRDSLRNYFEKTSAMLVNAGPRPAEVPSEHDNPDIDRRELEPREKSQLCLEKMIAALQAGHEEIALDLLDGPSGHALDAATVTGALAEFLRNGHAALLAYARDRLTREPQLTAERWAGRTLLHEAAARGNLEFVGLLLQLGADPNALDAGGHTPLHALANERTTPGGEEIVHALIHGGASVDLDLGVKRATPLHSAARRDNLEIARALLECGAELEARDSRGETPLRRAVNCNKVAVASLLLARGANPRSPGSGRLTPLTAARSDAMRRALSHRGSHDPLP